jgi:hypothetical protein
MFNNTSVPTPPAADVPEEFVERQRTQRIAELNDRLRTNGIGGQIMMTASVQALGDDLVKRAILLLRTFNSFTDDNDPYQEHDFGQFELDGQTFFWKIDYYARGEDGEPQYEYGSEDPSDPAATQRVLTLMLAQDY